MFGVVVLEYGTKSSPFCLGQSGGCGRAAATLSRLSAKRWEANLSSGAQQASIPARRRDVPNQQRAPHGGRENQPRADTDDELRVFTKIAARDDSASENVDPSGDRDDSRITSRLNVLLGRDELTGGWQPGGRHKFSLTF